MGKYITFVNQDKPEKGVSKYDAGIIVKVGNQYGIGYSQRGAEDTFSIGQPIYDCDDRLVGYLGIIMFESLNYATDKDTRIPVECWGIMLPTKYCEYGKKIKTYWQIKEEENA